jgi:hypothetical protein
MGLSLPFRPGKADPESSTCLGEDTAAQPLSNGHMPRRVRATGFCQTALVAPKGVVHNTTGADSTRCASTTSIMRNRTKMHKLAPRGLGPCDGLNRQQQRQ